MGAGGAEEAEVAGVAGGAEEAEVAGVEDIDLYCDFILRTSLCIGDV